MKDVALAVMRLQPPHNGHRILIETALRERDITLVAIGSANKTDERNPLSYETRREALEAVFPRESADGRLIIFGINDIGAKTKLEWANFVMGEITRNNLPKPAVYYAGSFEDAGWFEGVLKPRIVDRLTDGGGISGSEIRNIIAKGGDPRDFTPREIDYLLEKYLNWRRARQ